MRSVVAARPPTGDVVGVLGAQFDPERTVAWLWGPWVEPDREWPTTGKLLLDRLLTRLPGSVRRLEAFLHTENLAGQRFLQAQGFSPGPATHIYTVPRTLWTPPEFVPSPALRPAHEVAFTRLHADTFPASGSTPAQALLDGRDGEHAIFAASDGLRLSSVRCACRSTTRRWKASSTTWPSSPPPVGTASAHGSCKPPCAGPSRRTGCRRRASV